MKTLSVAVPDDIDSEAVRRILDLIRALLRAGVRPSEIMRRLAGWADRSVE